jgi:hypothetical protein
VRPQVGLVLPGWFDPTADAEALALVFELLAVLRPWCRVLVASDRPDLLGSPVVPLSALADCEIAFCILDRELAASVGAQVPTRLVGPDTLGFNPDKWRIAFQDAKVFSELAGAPPLAPDPEAAGRRVLFIDHFVEPRCAVALVSAVRQRIGDVEILLTPPATFRLGAMPPQARAVAAAEDLTRDVALLVSTDPAALTCLDGPFRRGFLSPAGTLHAWPLHSAPTRERLLLYKGEEQDHIRLLDRAHGRSSNSANGAAPRAHLRPLISVVIPVYDRGPEILRLADSLVCQRYPNLEVLFVTNGSPPATLDAVRLATGSLMRKRMRVHHLAFPRAFGSATIPRDIGCYAARGKFLCILDSDDYLEPGFFDHFLSAPMLENAIYCPKKIYRNHGRDMGADFVFDHPFDGLGDLDENVFETLATMGNFLQNSGVIIPRSAFEQVGGIKHGLKYCEDYYLWMRLARDGAVVREHPGQVSISLHPGNNELAVGKPEWILIAKAAAREDGLY